MSKLPPGWCLASIADTGKYINGFAFKPQHREDKGRPIIRIQNLTRNEREINRTTLVPGDEFVVRPGEILVSWSATLDAFIWDREEALVNQHIFRVIPDIRLVTKKYLFYLLKEAIQEMQKTEHLHGSTMKHINRGPFMAHEVPIAPPMEQDRIVDEIEKHFTRLDDAVAALKRVQANLKRYRTSVLKAACEGRLVPTEAELACKEGRSYEPASELLKRILTERRAKWEADQLKKMIAAGKPPKNHEWKERYKEPKPPNVSMLAALPDGWIWATVEQISTKVVDGVHKKPDYVPSGVPFVTVKNLTAGPGINFDNLQYVTEADHEEFIRRANPEQDDILISKDGTLGVVRTIRTDQVFSIFVSVAMIKPVSSKLTNYLEMALCSPQVQIQMVPKGSGLQHIHLEDLREDCIPLPPLSEQQRITDACSRQISIIDALEKEVEKRSVHATALRQSILRTAFSGKLVPQDSNDEPASMLLKHIREERAALATNNGNHKTTLKINAVTLKINAVNGQRRGRVAKLAHPGRGGKGANKTTSAVGEARR